MGKSCETCKKWVEYHYWYTMDDQDKCFFKVMMGDFQHEMTIPDKFAERFKGKISRTIKLEARNGSICNVGVKRCADKLILKFGWEEFVGMHDLKNGDFLVFRYNGNSEFKVAIFDPSGCEKASSCVILNNSPPTEKLKSYHEHHPMRSLSNAMETSSSSTPSEPGDKSQHYDDLELNNVPTYMVSQTTHLTPVQKKKVEEKVQDLTSDIPILVIIMRKSYVSRRKCNLGIFKKYADKYLPQEKQTVVLQRHGKRWKMRLDVRPNGVRRLIHGWRQFVEDHDLKIGDVGLFDLLKDEKICTMNVHIIRATKCGF